ncbi:class I SAM-dependent methyltransferase [Serinibacter salmoneus]|uniref:THUMP-like domain-containing protein n=1 Tax=Serinibacter salmoneus TaxID=556530 RepID=A0A2A9CX51_9MICO|nr:class I SAM-dependent methyltransferase [Serinibacter salmoneus]PFG18983.1 hypothetical protein ATL40_0537 [Serinibacter salmoneus]
MDLDALSALAEPAGWALLAELPPYDEKRSLALGSALREAGFDPALVAAALTQSRLRAKAVTKFGDLARDMLFTPDGLEQATRLSLAGRHAHRYAQAGVRTVADLGCGIGADAMALAGMDLRVLAVERDPATALVAGVNLRQLPEARVIQADALDPAAVDLNAVDGIWADPARRTGKGRVHRLADHSPDPHTLMALRERVPALGMKLGSALAHREIPDDAHAQWISVDGQTLEADLWFGPLAPEGPGRSALVIQGESATNLTWQGTASSAVEQAPDGPLAGYLYEPDGAIIRAGLVAEVARTVGGHLIDPTIAYITSATLTPTPLATAFRVLDSMGFSLKRLRAYLRERGVGRLEIKKRGSALDPATLRGQLSLRGPNSATIVLTRIRGAAQVLVVERVPHAEET